MAIMIFRGTLDPQETVQKIKTLFPTTGLSVQLVDEAYRLMSGSETHLLVFEKYFMRVKNYVSLSVMITSDQGVTEVYAVGSGAGNDALFSFDWGSEGDIVFSFSKIIEKMGFIKIA
jgi:hypothetical protein